MQVVNTAFGHLERYIKPSGIKILSLIGLSYLAAKTLGVLSCLGRSLFYLRKNLPERYGAGSWVLITGGAQGIGAAFAHELAAQGFNLILIDIKESILNVTANTLRTKYAGIQVKTLVRNFANSWQEGFFDGIFEEIGDLDISILINNVGASVAHGPNFYYNLPERKIISVIGINILPTAIFTRRLIPSMLKRKNKSAIINLSSNTGIVPIPTLTTYSATKAFVDFFSRAVQGEVGDRIDVMSVRPSDVSTELIRSPPVGGFVISPTTFVQTVLGKLGHFSVTAGHWRHEVKQVLTRVDFLRNIAVSLHKKRMFAEAQNVV